MQAIFNYYTVTETFKKPVRRFIVYECKKSRNKDGSSQLKRYVIDFTQCEEDFKVFHRLVKDATAEISTKAVSPEPVRHVRRGEFIRRVSSRSRRRAINIKATPCLNLGKTLLSISRRRLDILLGSAAADL